MNLITTHEKNAQREARAAAQADDYQVRLLNPLLGLCAVTHRSDPKRDYRTTARGCSCRDFERNHGLACKHQRIRASYLRSATLPAPNVYPVPFGQFLREECG